MRYLGIDYGSQKVGLALSDEAGTMGFPHGILPNTPRLLATVFTLMRDESVGAVVIGHSRDFAGAANRIAAAAQVFGEQIAREGNMPVYYEDETMTSAEARRAPAKEEKSRKPVSHEAVDASAAALILTSYLSKRKNG